MPLTVVDRHEGRSDRGRPTTNPNPTAEKERKKGEREGEKPDAVGHHGHRAELVSDLEFADSDGTVTRPRRSRLRDRTLSRVLSRDGELGLGGAAAVSW